jgi:3-oxoacyl-[acyl-carrier-protein] synthase II
MTKPSVSLYGCGLVTPFGTDLASFLRAMWENRSALKPAPSFHGTCLVGRPQFDFENYRDWIVSRANEKRFTQLQKAGGNNVLFTVGAFIDALRQNPGLEDFVRERRERVCTLIGTGLADLDSIIHAHRQLEDAQFEWDRFWGRELADQARALGTLPSGITDPASVTNEREALCAARAFYSYFARQNERLKAFIEAYSAIENQPLGQADQSLLNQLKAKSSRRLQLRKDYGCPLPPWESVSPNVLWNIPNLPAAQISMLLASHGLTAGVSGACSTFALSLRMGIDEIDSGRADVAIVGTTDGDPRPELLAAFHAARVAAFGRQVVFPLTELRGTHVAGGSCVWILCRDDVAKKAGLTSLGVRVRGVAVTSDGEHVITPSADGPSFAVRQALALSGVDPAQIQSWDLHCTGTPGDTQELAHVARFASKDAVLTARKGLFGHGMSSCGGWELTAQMLAPYREDDQAIIPPTGVRVEDLNAAISNTGLNLVCTEKSQVILAPGRTLVGAKLNMGVGGVSSCIICERSFE